MGREVRMVPKNWEHPKDKSGNYIALFDSDFEECADNWDKEYSKWNRGIYPVYANEESKKMGYEEFEGERPDKNDYMPSFLDGTKNYYMMYETTTEGKPISPAFETPEELARWLYDNKASAFGDSTASYEGWLRVAEGDYAPSAVYSDKLGLQNGVDALNN